MANVGQIDPTKPALERRARSEGDGDCGVQRPSSRGGVNPAESAGENRRATEYEVHDSSAKTGKFSKMVTDLGKRLSIRTNREDLAGKSNIKDDGSTAPPLASRSNSEKEMEKGKLAQRLLRRPSKTDLKLRNILRVDSSDSLVQQTGDTSLKSMKLEMQKNKLKSILKKRPERTELKSHNIIKSPESVDPAIAPTVERLQRARLENHLEHLIQERPSPEEMAANPKLNIFFNETVQILPTFRCSEYNRKPDMDVTFRRLTPKLKIEIREELNLYKRNEMPVHEQSLRNTAFH